MNHNRRTAVISSILRRAIQGTALVACLCIQTSAWADDGGKFSISGFLRAEGAYKYNDAQNPFNQSGNPYDGVTVPNNTLNALGAACAPTCAQTRPASYASRPDWNLADLRAAVDMTYQFNEWATATAKLRAVGDFTKNLDGSTYNNSNFYQVPFYGTRAGPLEANGKYWDVDLPAAYLDIHKGPWWLRAGNQQIAWGEAIFFRVLDLPDGLDLRNHSILDVAGEEYSEIRVPSLALRGSYSFQNGSDFDAYVSRFAPTVYANPNTPYNVIPSQFYIDQAPGFERARNDLDFGARFSVKFDELTLQFVAVNRLNPDGVFSWTAARGPNAVCAPAGCTPFQISPLGVYSSAEWFATADAARLDGVGGLQSVYSEFPGAAQLRNAFGLPSVTNKATATTNLDAFFGNFPLVGWLSRDYLREHNFGAAANYIFSATPGTVLDQLVMRGEVSYTPNKRFTNPNLSSDYITKNEVDASLVFEKYYRFSDRFPSTYMILEGLYKSASDLFGRSLAGFGENNGVPTNVVGNYKAVAFALQQPFPNLIWRGDFTILYDLQGGLLIQPGLRYKPTARWQIDAYANYVSGGNKTSTGTFDKFTDEVFARFTMYF
jgi:hypothetical protein